MGRNYRLNRYEILVLLLAALLTFLQYGRVFLAPFPVEEEARIFLAQMHQASWSELWGIHLYHSLYPVANLLIKLQAIAIVSLKSFWPLRVLIFGGHLSCIYFLYLILRQELAAEQSDGLLGGWKVWLPGIGAFVFSSSNAYYLLLLSGHNGPIHVVAASLSLASFHLWLSAEERWSTQQLCLSLLIAALLPNIYFYPFPFFALLAYAYWRQRRRDTKAFACTAAVYLIFFALIALCFDGRTSVMSGDSTRMGQTLGQIFLSNPLLFVSSAFHNTFGGAFFGLFFQNFLWGTAAYSWPYMVGAAMSICLLFMLVSGRKELREQRLVLLGFSLIVLSLLNVALLRNIFVSEEPGRIYDAAYVASMPRYYYWPSLGLAMLISACLHVVVKHFSTRWVFLTVLALWILAGVSATREKVFYAAEHFAPEIWRFTPTDILRPPLAHAQNQSYRADYPQIPPNR